MNEIVIREAGLDELPRIADLKYQIHQVHVNGRPDLFTPYSSLDAFVDHSAAKGCSLLLAEMNGRIAGYAMLQFVHRPNENQCFSYLQYHFLNYQNIHPTLVIANSVLHFFLLQKLDF